ncbi:MAG: microtubule-binding protein [Bdellovibrionaceae bacterium]|nr:microtubule-binding protein [Pseudobdellovibrionaceae bacterium]
MAFDYDKSKHKHEAGHEWVAFSDLYLCLSTVFLLLFVVASLRQGTATVQAEMMVAKLRDENQKLKYTVQQEDDKAKDYMERDAAEQEKAAYDELMNKLTLLQDEADKEKDALRAQAGELEKKEKALNQYQLMVKHIINKNMISQAKIKRRDDAIVTKNEEISEQADEIQDLEQDVAQKKATIEQGERKITNMNAELDKRMKQLRRAYEANQISKKNFESQKAKLQAETQERVAALREQNEQIEGQLQQVAGALTEREKALAQAQSTIEAKNQETNRLQSELQGAEAKRAAQIAGLKKQFEADQARARGEFEAELARQKLSAAQRAAKEAQYRDQAAARERELGDKIAGLNSKMKDTEGELAKAKELANARKKLTEQIKSNFAKAGVKASVDEGTGDVIIDFGDQYFETGRADLKPQMAQALTKTMPVYSASLFSDPKVAAKIQGIEIIGFASPTYKGKVVDPKSLNPEDRRAVDYNLDLSYARAKSIFNYAFDPSKLQFKHQKELLPLVKVTGRSFLAETKGERSVASGMSEKEFCKQYDCKKAQRVIIKFNLGE